MTTLTKTTDLPADHYDYRAAESFIKTFAGYMKGSLAGKDGEYEGLVLVSEYNGTRTELILDIFVENGHVFSVNAEAITITR